MPKYIWILKEEDGEKFWKAKTKNKFDYHCAISTNPKEFNVGDKLEITINENKSKKK